MWWADRRRVLSLAGSLAALALVSGCTVQPLYGTAPSGGASGDARLASVAVKPVRTRAAQQVRNHLIFLMNGGRGEPDDAAYEVDLGAAASASGAMEVNVPSSDDLVPTAITVTMTSLYKITDRTSGETVATGKRVVSTSYDRPRQEFAAQRAALDAEDRAARELAEVLRLAILADLKRIGG